MTTAPTPDLRALAEAAEGNGEHIYTHPIDSNKWRENEAWHRAASPGAVLHLLDRIAELEARKPLAKHALRKVLNETAANIDSPNIVMTHWELVARSTERAHGITGGSS